MSNCFALSLYLYGLVKCFISSHIFIRRRHMCLLFCTDFCQERMHKKAYIRSSKQKRFIGGSLYSIYSSSSHQNRTEQLREIEIRLFRELWLDDNSPRRRNCTQQRETENCLACRSKQKEREKPEI